MVCFVSFSPFCFCYLKWVGVGSLFSDFGIPIFCEFYKSSVIILSPFCGIALKWFHSVACQFHPSLIPPFIHRASATVCLGTLSTFSELHRTLGSWGVGGHCGLETNLCSFTMNQKKPHFFQDLVTFRMLLHCSVSSAITISLPKPRMALEKYCYSKNYLVFLKRYQHSINVIKSGQFLTH